MLNAIGYDHQAVDLLLGKFKHTYEFHMVCKRTGRIRRKKLKDNGLPNGNPRDLHAIGALGMVLMWFRTKGSCTRHLAMIFGQTKTPMYKWLLFSKKVLLHVLSRDPDAKVQLPSISEVKFFQEVIGAKYPRCANVWAAADGLKLKIQGSGD